MFCKNFACALVIIALASIACLQPAWSGEMEDGGRAVYQNNQKAVVTVQLVIQQKFSSPSMGSQENEEKSEVTGMIIDPSGLTVVSLFRTDPSSLYEKMMSGMDESKIEINVDSAKYLMDDGTEVPATVVLRDKDLDLAFLMPKTKPEQPMPAIDLTQTATPLILDPIVALVRLGKAADRVCSATLERVQAVIEKPRTLYVPGGEISINDLGAPVFSLDGKVIGMIALRSIKVESSGGFGGGDEGVIPVIVPAADIKEAAAQATAEE